MTVKKQINKKDTIKQVLEDPILRKTLAKRSFFWFFILYLPEYIKYHTANFQKEMFEIAQDDATKAAVITAFRGSGKSTIVSLAYPIWAMLTGKKNFIVILSQNQSQAKLILTNIRAELEKNEPLMADFGPFKQIAEEWSQNTLLIEAYGCRITAASSGESIRGIRHRQHRPDLIILDDVEDQASTRTKDSRDKTFNWVSREVIPSGDSNTKLIVIGNKLHEDGLMMRLKKAIMDKYFSAIYREYPLLSDEGVCLWPEKFKNQADIDSLKNSVVSESAWQREYLLKIVPEEDAVVLREWIHFYDILPQDDRNFRYYATGIDLAISQGSSADFTAMVPGCISGYNEKLKIYILPHPVNKRMTFPDTLEAAKNLSLSLGNGVPTRLFIEDVGYQASIIQQLTLQGFPAESVKTGGQDKRARLASITYLIKSGQILFPKKGYEELIGQLVGFGYEKHDDLADAFTILVTRVLKDSYYPPILIGKAW